MLFQLNDKHLGRNSRFPAYTVETMTILCIMKIAFSLSRIELSVRLTQKFYKRGARSFRPPAKSAPDCIFSTKHCANILQKLIVLQLKLSSSLCLNTRAVAYCLYLAFFRYYMMQVTQSFLIKRQIHEFYQHGNQHSIFVLTQG